MKKRILITIDEELLKKAKQVIPNLSKFFNDSLKYILGENGRLHLEKTNSKD